MPRAVFLESRAGTWSLFTRGLASGARASGWEVFVLPLAGVSGDPRPHAELERDLRRAAPDRVVFLMDAALAHAWLWLRGPLRGIPTDALWYDDWMRSAETLGGRAAWAALSSAVLVRIWDAYWAERWERRFGFPAAEALLAAAPEDFDSQAEPEYPEFCDKIVFVGTVPSRAGLEKDAEAFPPFLRRVLCELDGELERAPWPIDAYGAADRAVAALPPRALESAERWMADPTRAALWNTQVWRRGKRAARLRGLRAVAAVAPLAVVSGHRSEPFAGGDELRGELGTASLEFRETTSLSPGAWSGLFRSGALQVQVTDPQSVESGVPFRWFETAACGVPLATDARPGLARIALPEELGLLAHDPEHLAGVVDRWRRVSRSVRTELGALRRTSFLNGHTWAARWQALIESGRGRLRSVPMHQPHRAADSTHSDACARPHTAR